jgi:hypothetical protein
MTRATGAIVDGLPLDQPRAFAKESEKQEKSKQCRRHAQATPQTRASQFMQRETRSWLAVLAKVTRLFLMLSLQAVSRV